MVVVLGGGGGWWVMVESDFSVKLWPSQAEQYGNYGSRSSNCRVWAHHSPDF